ncbi:hypothetical protein KUTeg_012320 [Tegillarca granosa]|uniref:Uncharacterized protein n=1 Tax=Tegillarca granosa TaxID=220873 RepID=A0ABQ9F4B6_TEGGR|nr:hypothetical protein KUTeg_012320 [Tegillarca granosa]
MEVTASNSSEIEDVLLSDDAFIASSTEIQTTSDIKTEDDMHIDSRFRFKAEPEERLPSLMQISRCEMSDTDSDIGDEKANLDTKIPISADSLPLFESSKDAEQVPNAPVNDWDKNKHLNLHMVDIMDNKSTKFESVLEDEDADYINKSSDNNSVSDLEEYWSLREHVDTINEETNLVNLLAQQQVSDNVCRTVVNELGIDSSNIVNEYAKHTESLQVCNEGDISETALSNHRKRSVGHSTNLSTNDTSVITPDSKAGEPINIEIRANNAMQSQSEIHGFNKGLGNLNSTNEATQAEVKVNVRDIASKWQMYKRPNKINNEQEQTPVRKQQDESCGVKAGSNEPVCLKSAAANENSKPNKGRVPPKTLPKPVMKTTKQLLESNDVALVTNLLVPSSSTQLDIDQTSTTCLHQDLGNEVKSQENQTQNEDYVPELKQENSDFKHVPKLSTDVVVSGMVKDQTENSYQNNDLDSVKTSCSGSSGMLSSANERVVESNDVVDALTSQNKSYLETDNKLLSGPEDVDDKSPQIALLSDEPAKIESGDDTATKTESCELKQLSGVKTSEMQSQLSDVETKSRVPVEQISEREGHTNAICLNDNQNSKVDKRSGNKFMKPDNKFGLTKSLMAAKPYVKTEADINKMPDLDSELFQGGNLACPETSISTTIGSPKLKAIRIKQEVFPKEDTDDSSPTDNLISLREKDKTGRDAAQWISPIKEALYQLKKQENIEHGNYKPNVKFFISDSDDGYLGHSMDQKPMLANVDYKHDGGEAMYYPRSPGTVQKQFYL